METRKKSSLQVMLGLLGMIKPLLGIMCIAVIMGALGHLAAIFLTVLGGYGMLIVLGDIHDVTMSVLFVILGVLAVVRGVLRYAEQACNHYIAFKLLARIRHKVFDSLRRLAPAKLDSNNKGNLISIITSDIELLEVFYAHTISPVLIAIVTTVVMIAYLACMHPILALIGLVFYVLAGVVIPLVNGRMGRFQGQKYRKTFGNLNTIILDNLYGLFDICQYRQQEKRILHMQKKTDELEQAAYQLKKAENLQKIFTDAVILLSGVTTILVGGYLVSKRQLDFSQMLLAMIAVISSFGPVAALSALSNNLSQTLASGDRVLHILEEKPVVEEITQGTSMEAGDIECKDITFSYGERPVLQQMNVKFTQNKIHGICGESGCGKSTLLKLLMRFYKVNQGKICYGEGHIDEIVTESLRSQISYVTQETFLFQDTIENNIKIAKEDATREEVIQSAKKASIHEFIVSLPCGYDTKLSELGESVSGGERQRIGLARAFLHGSKIIFLDEPTSNIDSINEGIILQSLKKERKNKTIILVSHRKSTMGIADKVLYM